MAGLPQWNNSRAATNYYEPVFQNQFEVIITPPAIITQNVDLLVEHVISVDGLPEISPSGIVEQRYKFAVRTYADAAPKTTAADLDIKFTVNLNEDNNMYIYNILRAWADLTWDPETGRQGLKRDHVGEMYVGMFTKAGDIYREWKFKSMFPHGGLTPVKLNYMSNDLYEANVKFRADDWKEPRIGKINV